jgi:hypothetical protein
MLYITSQYVRTAHTVQLHCTYWWTSTVNTPTLRPSKGTQYLPSEDYKYLLNMVVAL